MFDVEKITNEIIAFIREYFEKFNLKGVVLGISGGKDSAVVAGLFCKALGSDKVIGLTLPCHSNEQDKIDAKKVSNHFGFKLLNLELTNVYDVFVDEFDKNFKEFGIEAKDLIDSNINLKPKLRMASLYYVAQALSQFEKQGYLVAGTSNLCELYVGYFTKGGDNVCDISVLGDLTVSEVLAIGDYIDVPKEILYKAPSDGLSNLTDEEKMEIKYADVEKVIYGKPVSVEAYQKIKKLHEKNAYKFFIPTYKKG
ncbi:MAG: NAD(+) synthase [Mollicutes bacterium]|nr:NAD(+) synthase [Mollicutes bacterium]